MNDRETMTGSSEINAFAAAIRAGDESAFGALAERHRRELLVHCYRMLGSFHDAEDAVQDAFLRAWRYRESVKDGAPLRPWLYRVATKTLGFPSCFHRANYLPGRDCPDIGPHDSSAAGSSYGPQANLATGFVSRLSYKSASPQKPELRHANNFPHSRPDHWTLVACLLCKGPGSARGTAS